jgi:hypothetical protein
MKRLLFIPLLALPLLFLSCDGQPPTEPDSEATFAKATMTLNLHAYCPSCTQDGDTFYTDGVYRAFYYFACPAEKGAIQLYRCMSSSGSYMPSDMCEEDAGANWERANLKWAISARKNVTCNAYMSNFYGNVSGGSQGWKITYSPRGSGYFATEYVWDVSADAGPT